MQKGLMQGQIWFMRVNNYLWILGVGTNVIIRGGGGKVWFSDRYRPSENWETFPSSGGFYEELEEDREYF
jgi:hypothetical protein